MDKKQTLAAIKQLKAFYDNFNKMLDQIDREALVEEKKAA